MSKRFVVKKEVVTIRKAYIKKKTVNITDLKTDLLLTSTCLGIWNVFVNVLVPQKDVYLN